jgi:hypothetical protein
MTRSIRNPTEAGSRDVQAALGDATKNTAMQPSSDVTSSHQHPVRDARRLIRTIRGILGQASPLPDAFPNQDRQRE